MRSFAVLLIMDRPNLTIDTFTASLLCKRIEQMYRYLWNSIKIVFTSYATHVPSNATAIAQIMLLVLNNFNCEFILPSESFYTFTCMPNLYSNKKHLKYRLWPVHHWQTMIERKQAHCCFSHML